MRKFIKKVNKEIWKPFEGSLDMFLIGLGYTVIVVIILGQL